MDEPRHSIGAVGLWTSVRQWAVDPAEFADAAAEIEALGYGAVWLGGAPGDLSLPEALLGATTTLTVATGIVDIWRNDAPTVAANHRRVTDSFPGRFLLGPGMGHAAIVEPATGLTYEKPLANCTATSTSSMRLHRPFPSHSGCSPPSDPVRSPCRRHAPPVPIRTW